MKRIGLRVGINGFGRIGRAVCRLLLEQGVHSVVHVNDLNTDEENLAYLLKYDTIYGRLKNVISAKAKEIRFDEQRIRVTHSSDISEVDWASSKVDVVVEATGVYKNEVQAKKLRHDGLHVLITHVAPSADFSLIFGVTDRSFDPGRHKVVSTGICDANACAPVLKALDDAFGVMSGFITTLHPWLSYQNLMDGPPRSQSYPGATYSHYPLGRSSIGTLIPKPTTVVSACARVLPKVMKNIQCFSYRVPTSIVSTADLTLQFRRSVTKESIIKTFRDVKKRYPTVPLLRITDEPLISADYLADPHSAIIDTRWIMVNQGRSAKIVLWYDNEWGYSSRVVDAIGVIADSVGD